MDKACEERQRVVVQLVLDCQVGREGGREGEREESCNVSLLFFICYLHLFPLGFLSLTWTNL